MTGVENRVDNIGGVVFLVYLLIRVRVGGVEGGVDTVVYLLIGGWVGAIIRVGGWGRG